MRTATLGNIYNLPVRNALALLSASPISMKRCIFEKKVRNGFENNFVQENICSPSGLDCFRQIRLSHKCLPPCRGLYLDVNVDKNIPAIESYPEFQPAYESYVNWKKGIKLLKM